MDQPAWPVGGEDRAPHWYEDCFRNALRRVAATTNSSPPHETCEGLSLDQSDQKLAATFLAKGWDKSLIQFNRAAYDPLVDSDEHRAEFFFYSDIDFAKRAGARVARFLVPDTFLDWGYKRLRCPEGSTDDLGVAEFGSSTADPAFVAHCATNYLVKNFWHNFVHRIVQGISSANYHEFRGLAREDSDFEADHLANLLLVRSYGLPIYSKGKIGENATGRIRALFARNRCNLVFAERAMHRIEDRQKMTWEEKWEELEWRFCRSLSNAISSTLIADGLTPPSVRIFLSGDVRTTTGESGFRIWRTGSVVAEVAGLRLNSGCAPYIPIDEMQAEDGGRKLTDDRRKRMRALRAKRELEIVTNITTAYRRRILEDPGLSQSVEQSLAALAMRMGVRLLST
jgi:hypothetical protein